MIDTSTSNRVIDADGEYVAVAHIVSVHKTISPSYRLARCQKKFLWFTYETEIYKQRGFRFFVVLTHGTATILADTYKEAEIKMAYILELIEELDK